MFRGLVVLMALVSASPAYALDAFMWGVGPQVGTMIVPGGFPAVLPPAVVDDAGLEKVRADVEFGVNAVYYANESTRIGVSGEAGVAAGYFDMNMLVRYDWIGSSDALHFVTGAAAGFGTMRFSGAGQSELRVPYYPLRVEAGALIPDHSRAYQGLIYAKYDLPSNHFYTNQAGEDTDVGTGFYGTIGVELAVYLGDFSPPRAHKGKH